MTEFHEIRRGETFADAELRGSMLALERDSERLDQAVVETARRYAIGTTEALARVREGLADAREAQTRADLGAGVDPDAAELDRRIRAYEEEHGCTYIEAAHAVGEEIA